MLAHDNVNMKETTGKNRMRQTTTKGMKTTTMKMVMKTTATRMKIKRSLLRLIHPQSLQLPYKCLSSSNTDTGLLLTHITEGITWDTVHHLLEHLLLWVPWVAMFLLLSQTMGCRGPSMLHSVTQMPRK
jgi:hypothetical protein